MNKYLSWDEVQIWPCAYYLTKAAEVRGQFGEAKCTRNPEHFFTCPKHTHPMPLCEKHYEIVKEWDKTHDHSGTTMKIEEFM